MSSFDTVETLYSAVYVVLKRGSQIAFVKRSNTSWMNGYYCLAAGKVDKGESIKQAAAREALEEAGVVIKQSDLKHLITMHRRGEDGTIWADVYFETSAWEGEPYNAEPDIHSELSWFDLDDLPENTLPMTIHALEAAAKGETYTEFGW